MSPTVPPATLKNALPASPAKNRTMIMVSMFCATAQGINQSEKTAKETM